MSILARRGYGKPYPYNQGGVAAVLYGHNGNRINPAVAT
jgi:hypothetical protein